MTGKNDEIERLLRSLVQEARQHTLLLAQILDELAATRQGEPHDHPPGHPGSHPHVHPGSHPHVHPGSHPHVHPGGERPAGVVPGGRPLDVQDLAAVLPERGDSVYLHAAPEPDAAVIASVRAGSIVHVLEEHGEWVRVAPRDGTAGWVRVAVLGEV